MNLKGIPVRSYLKRGSILFLILICCTAELCSQTGFGFLKGRVVDAMDNRPIQGAIVGRKSGTILTSTAPDGSFVVRIDPGTQSFSFMAKGYKNVVVSKIPITLGLPIELVIRLNPSELQSDEDTTINKTQPDSTNQINYQRNVAYRVAHAFGIENSIVSIYQNWLQPGLSKDLSTSLTLLSAVNQQEKILPNTTSRIMVNGMNGRYVNTFLNGVVQSGFPAFDFMPNLSVLPNELIDKVSLRTVRDASTPGEFGSGHLMISLKVKPDQNFFYLQTGSEFQGKYANDEFFGDNRKFKEWASLPGFTGNLPEGFPGAKTESRLVQKNPQEKSDLLKTLPNSLSSKAIGSLSPASRFTIAWGRNYVLKAKQQIGLIFLLNHQNQESIFHSTVMTAPNVSANPYPFSNTGARVIRSLSDNINFQQYSYLNGFFSASIAWNKSRLSASLLYSGTDASLHVQTNSILKPDEDSLANKRILYNKQQAKTANISVKGDHAFGKTGKFRIEWNIGYQNYKQNNPDERTFLLRQDSIRDDFFQLALPQTQPIIDRGNVSRSVLNANLDAIFTNSYRSWRKMNDHNFVASAGMSTPVQVFKLHHIMAGGLQMQTQYRELYSDLLLYRGPGYFNIDGLIAPQRYFPGGLEADEYYLPLIGQTGSFNPRDVNAANYGNYLGSINIGAGYFSNETKLNKKTSLKLGIRFETTSQLVSLFEYHYFEGFKDAEKVTLDENVNISSFDLLPSLGFTYNFLPGFDFTTSYFRSLNRPKMHELTDYRSYDPASFMITRGNRLLEISTIDNVDASLSFKPTSFSFIKINAFYKKIYKPIEYLLEPFAASIGNQLSTPTNMPEATVKAIQGSFQLPFSNKSLSWLSKLQVFGAFTLLESKVKAGPLKSLTTPFTEEHTLSGSPNYSFNTGLILSMSKYPSVRVDFEQTGDYLMVVGSGRTINLVNGLKVLANPHYYSKGRSLLNAQVSQQFFRTKMLLTVGVDNLFAEDMIVYQDLNGNEKFDEPLKVFQSNGNTGYYSSGIDNTVRKQGGFRSYIVRLSYQFQK